MNKKNVGLVIAVLLVVLAIWYLDSIKVRPGAGSGGAAQTINVAPTNVSGTSTPAVNSTTTPSETTALQTLAAADKAAGYQPAIEIADPTGFINASSSFRLANLIGKQVVLLDFWTYSCINFIRTLPYLTPPGTRNTTIKTSKSSASTRRNSTSKRISRTSKPPSHSTAFTTPSCSTATTEPGPHTATFIGRMNI